MNGNLAKIGYELAPSKYSPALGYSRLRVLISGHPTERYFDIKALHIPTFDGRFLHKTQIDRHELVPKESFQVCLGQLSLETFRGERINAFSFGGNLQAEVSEGDLYCDLTSTAPIFKIQDAPDSVNVVVVSEIMDLLAEREATLAGHEDELYARLVKFEPYTVFIGCLISMQKRLDSVPMALRRERVRKLSSNLQRAIKIVHDSDGWDDHAPSLENLLSDGGV